MSEASFLAFCLTRLAWSPERLASEINRRCGSGTISSKAPYNWLKGSRPRRQLPQVVAKILSDRLGEPVTVEALWPDHQVSPDPLRRIPAQRTPDASERTSPGNGLVTAAVDWLVADHAEPPVRPAGEELPAMAVEALTDRVRQLRRLDDDAFTTRLVMDWALEDLRWARTLTTEYSYDAATGAELHRVIAELGQLAGWLAADLGMTQQSHSCFLTALTAARVAGDRPLAAYVISCMSYRAVWDGRGEEALRLIRIARKGAGREGTGIEQALLATREARAHAALGDAEACQRVLDTAAALCDGDGPGPAAPWAYWLTPAVMVADAGRAWLELGRPDRAEPHLVRGIGMLGSSQPLNRLLHSASLAEARLARNEVDGAAAAAGEALSLAERITSQRARIRLASLRRRFTQHDSVTAHAIVERADALPV
ncbi:hypothetical protein ACWD4B_11550 [Streptomyces sp. NPDC002536]